MLFKILPFLLLLLDAIFGLFGLFSLDRGIVLCLFMAAWMIAWWIFEVMPLGITALIPMFFLPFYNVVPLKEVTPHYANPVIYLFLGGFIIARAIEKTDLSRRIALVILKLTGKSDRGIVLGFTITTALISMWISNTATAVMMVPIAMAVMQFLEKNTGPENAKDLKAMGLVLFLTIAYSANIGGIMTPVGTPPNVVLMGFLNEIYKTNIDFWRWMIIATPVAIGLLFLQSVLLAKLYPYRVKVDSKFQDYVRQQLKALGKVSSEQRVTIFVFSMTAALWISKDVIHWLVDFKFLEDTSIAILGGVLLFLIPTQKKQHSPVLVAEDIPFLPWDIVLLFGGGMAMASALGEVGIIQMTTEALGSLGITSPFLLIALLAAASLLLTELVSNVALCVVALPVMMQLGVSLNINPVLIGIPVALCASLAFSMPISTPPNAIVFGTGKVKITQMMRAGILMNIISIIIVMSVGWMMMALFL